MRLADVAAVSAGNPAPQDQASFDGGTYPFFRTSDVGRVRIGRLTHSENRLNAKGTQKLKLHKAGTILLPKSGASTYLDHRVVMDVDGYVSSHLATVFPKSDIVDGKFLFYALLTISARELSADSSYPTLSLKQVQDIEVGMPPLDEQRRIVAVLDKAFAGIATATANAQKNLTNARATLKSCLNDMFSQRSSTWQCFELGSVCLRLHQGLNTAGEKIEFHPKGYPIIQTRNIDNGKVNTTEKMKFVSGTDWEKYKERYRPEIGDVFFTNIGTIGKTAVIETNLDYLIHWNIFKLRPDFNIILPYYLKIYLDYLTESGHFLKMQTGGTVNFVTKKMISTSIIFVPPISEQQVFVFKAENLTKTIERLHSTYEQKLIALSELKQSLLQKAFAGNLT